MCTSEPLDPASSVARWWAGRAVVLDAEATPAITGLLDGYEACVVRPDRYVMARGSVDEVTAFAATALGTPIAV